MLNRTKRKYERRILTLRAIVFVQKEDNEKQKAIIESLSKELAEANMRLENYEVTK